MPENYHEKVQSWLQYNWCQTVIWTDKTSVVGLPCEPNVPVVGHFNLSEIGNMNQTPLAFDFLGSWTYDTKDAKTVFQKETWSGWDKWQCTLQVCVFADGKLYF